MNAKSKTNTRVKARYERRRKKTNLQGESLTRQSEAKSADINHIVAKAKRTGYLPIVNHGESIPEVTGQTFHEAMNVVAAAKQQFMELPSDVRQEFDNDPAKLLDCLHSDKEEDKNRLIELGVVEPPPAPVPPTQVEIINNDPPPATE
jgi:phage internal scaffolding protein